MRLVLLVVLLFTVRSATAFYDPTVGKWISRDPIGERGGANLNTFVKNSPTLAVDYIGLSDDPKCCCCRANSISIDNIGELKPTGKTQGKFGDPDINYGNTFTINASLTYEKNPNNNKDCHLKWEEKSTSNMRDGQIAGQWMDKSGLKNSHTLANWNNRKMDCTKGGDSISFPDRPSTPLGSTTERVLYIKVTIQSGCDDSTKTEYFAQICPASPDSGTFANWPIGIEIPPETIDKYYPSSGCKTSTGDDAKTIIDKDESH